MASAKRTPSGAPTAAARRKTGFRSDGAYPIDSRQQAQSAINLRNNSTTHTGKQVLDKVAGWANKNNDPVIKAKVKAARAKDAQR